MVPTADSHPMRTLAGMVPCKTCGRPIDPQTSEYSEEGELICPNCRASEQVAAGEYRALQALKSAAYGACIAGLASVCVNPFFIASIFAISGGAGVLGTLKSNPDYRVKLGAQYKSIQAAAWLAIAFGALLPVLRVVVVVGMALMAGR